LAATVWLASCEGSAAMVDVPQACLAVCLYQFPLRQPPVPGAGHLRAIGLGGELRPNEKGPHSLRNAGLSFLGGKERSDLPGVRVGKTEFSLT
jgi:hypothetical protein